MNRRTNLPRITRGILIGLTVAAALCATSAIVAAGVIDRTPKPTGEGDLTVTRGEMTVSIDPRTGRLRQITPSDPRSFLSDAPRAHATPVEQWLTTKTAEGMLMIQLPEDFFEYTVMSIQPDGSLSTKCVKGSDEAEKLVNGDAAVLAQPAKAPEASIVKQPAKPASPAVQASKVKAARKAMKRTTTSTAGR